MANKQQVYIFISTNQMNFRKVSKKQFQDLMKHLQNIHQNFVVKMEMIEDVQFNNLIVL